MPQFVIVGGGIAGVSCAEQLAEVAPDACVTLISASPLIKAVSNVKQISRALTAFDVSEQDAASLSSLYPNVTVIHAEAVDFNPSTKAVSLSNGSSVTYDRLCICSGATPKLIATDHPRVIGIRDTQSVTCLKEALASARRVVIVGNGGIAMELAYAIEGCEVIWAVKDSSIGTTFFDGGAAKFFLQCVARKNAGEQSSSSSSDQPALDSAAASGSCRVFSASKRMRYTREDPVPLPDASASNAMGSALGPDWCESDGFLRVAPEERSAIRVVFSSEVSAIRDPDPSLYQEEVTKSVVNSATVSDWPVFVKLTNGSTYGCDFVVSATGVEPRVFPFSKCDTTLKLAEDGGIAVDSSLRTTVDNVYAAGDVCTAAWPTAQHWHQMRLWTQARQMGAYAALCMAEENGQRDSMDFCFELFTHVTKFFGYKVILLGLFNGQGLPDNHELLIRCTEGVEYVKVVLHDGRMQGAVLIGETDLEETFENLILNQMDLSAYGESLLDPGVDIEDYFD